MNRLMFVTLLTAAASLGLEAQTNVTAKIPFEFHAGKKTLPPGEYSLEFKSGWLMVRERDTGNNACALMSNPVISARPVQNAKLVFSRYGDAYFLKSVWDGLSADGRELPPTSVEKELAKNSGKGGNTIVVSLAKK